MSVVSIGLFGDITPLVVGFRATEYIFAACAALWTYDYFLTIDREIALVWRSRWSFGKIIFFLNRYFPIMVAILANTSLQGVKHQGECHKLAAVGLWSYLLGIFWSEIILAMRAWALWGGTRIVWVILTVVSMTVYISEGVLMDRFIKSITSITIPEFLVPVLGLDCASLIKSHDAFWPEFLIFFVYETVLATMALSKGFQRYRAANNPLLETMFHDGLLYYIYTIGLVIANVVVTVTAPIQWLFFLELPLGILSSIFATRVLLNIRATYFQPYNIADTTGGGRGANSTNFDFRTQQPEIMEYSTDCATRDHVASSSSSYSRESDFAIESVVIDELDYEEHEQSPSGQGWIWKNSP